ncbi:DUF6281 family protein [Streptomyces sp. NPDC059597]
MRPGVAIALEDAPGDVPFVAADARGGLPPEAGKLVRHR